MLTETQKMRITHRFVLFKEHMNKDGKDETILDAVKAITAQMDSDERWIATKLEDAYTNGSVTALLSILQSPD